LKEGQRGPINADRFQWKVRGRKRTDFESIKFRGEKKALPD